MIPPTFGIDHRRSPEFAGDQHHRALEQTTLLEILHQGRKALIQQRSQGAAQASFIVVVCIPLAMLVTGSRHESAAGFHQAPGQEHALPYSMARRTGPSSFPTLEKDQRLV